MKKRILITLAIIVVMLPLIAFSVPKPTATIKNFDIAEIALRDITFLFDIAIKNPYPVGLKLAGVKMKYSIEGKQFFETETSKGFTIKAKKEAVNEFTVNIKYADIIGIIKDYTQKEYLNTTVDTEIIIPLPKMPGLPPTISFKYTLHKKIPAIKPKVSVIGFAVVQPTIDDVTNALKKSGKNADPQKTLGMISDMLSGKSHDKVIDPASIDLKIKVSFDIELKNEAKGKLAFTKLNYDFLVDKAPLVSGETTKIAQKGDNLQVLTVVNEFSTRALAGPILSAFKKRKGAFLLKGNTFIKLPDEIKTDPVKLSFSEDGVFNMK
jgi:LEA14-like dessication related protein